MIASFEKKNEERDKTALLLVSLHAHPQVRPYIYLLYNPLYTYI